MDNIKHNKGVYYFFAVLSVFVFILPYYFCRYGIDFTDTPYHLLNAREYARFPSVVLSYWIINGWQACVGLNILYSRFFAVFLWQLAFILASTSVKCSFARRVIFFDAFNTLLASAGSLILGYDTVSILFIAATFACIAQVVKSQSKAWIWVASAGVFSAFATVARLPNLLLVGLCLAVFPLLTYKNTGFSWALLIKRSALYLVVFVLTLDVVLISFYGGIEGVLSKFTQNLSGESSSYGLVPLLKKYIIHFLYCLKWVGLVYLSVSGLETIQKITKRRRWTILFCVICFLVGFVYLYLAMSMYYPDLVFLLSAVMVCQVLGMFNVKRGQRRVLSTDIVFGCTVLVFSLIPAAGSNTGLLKIASVLFLPVTTAAFWFYFSSPMKHITISAIMLAAVCIPVQRIKTQYEEAPIQKTNSAVDHPYLYGVLTTPERKCYLEIILNEVKERNRQCIFVGKMRHIFEYLTGSSGEYSQNFWGTLNDDNYVMDLKKYLQTNKIDSIFIVSDYPETPPRFDQNSIETMLVDLGYVAESRNMPFKRYDLSEVIK